METPGKPAVDESLDHHQHQADVSEDQEVVPLADLQIVFVEERQGRFKLPEPEGRKEKNEHQEPHRGMAEGVADPLKTEPLATRFWPAGVSRLRQQAQTEHEGDQR